MKAYIILPAQFNDKTKEFEPIFFPNVAENVFMSFDSEETVADVINKLQRPKNNLLAKTDPTPSDSAGYTAESLWMNHKNGALWVCEGINNGSATWTRVRSGFGH